MQKLLKLLKIIDENLLGGLFTTFIFLIPLYPKLPLMMITYTYVAIRFDDIFMALIAVVFIVQLARGKVSINTRLLKMFLFFWGAVFVSYFIATFITHTIVYRQVGFLHALRRVEYMFIFFVAVSLIKKPADFVRYLFAAITSVFLITIYGIGQRVAEFPSVSTMNPEFAKGHVLFLTPEARIASTFAGHYDLGAYLVFIIPIIWGAYFVLHKKLHSKLGLAIGISSNITHTTSQFLEKLIGSVVYLARLRHSFLDPLKELRDDFEINKKTMILTIAGGIISIIFLASALKTLEWIIGGTLIVALFLFIG